MDEARRLKARDWGNEQAAVAWKAGRRAVKDFERENAHRLPWVSMPETRDQLNWARDRLKGASGD